MMSGGRTTRFAGVALAGLLVLNASEILAQGDPFGRGRPSIPIPPPTIGLRGGFDTDVEEWSVGGHIRFMLPFLPGPELLPSGDAFFGDEDTAWQVNLDAVIPLLPLIYAGGGLAVLHDSLLGKPTPSTETGYNLLVGFQAPFLPIPLIPFAEARWTSLNRILRRFRLVAGLNVPLGGRARARR